MAKFDAWWKLYPRKVSKPEALKAWAKHHLDDPDNFDLCMEVTAAWVRYWKAEDTAPKFIPYPATYLNRPDWTEAPQWIPEPEIGFYRDGVYLEVSE